MLTPVGLQKLEALSAKLKDLIQQIEDKKSELDYSPLSLSMVRSAVKLLDFFMTTNKLELLEKESYQNIALGLISMIDQGNATFLPAIFDDLSKVLTQALVWFFTPTPIGAGFSFTEECISTKAIAMLVDHHGKVVMDYVDRLKTNLKWYEMIEKSEETREKLVAFQEKIAALRATFLPLSPALSQADYQKLQDNYVAQAKELASTIEGIPNYLMFEGIVLNSNQPISLADDAIALVEGRRAAWNALIELEKDINEALVAQKFPALSFIRFALEEHYSEEETEIKKDRFLVFLNDFQQQLSLDSAITDSFSRKPKKVSDEDYREYQEHHQEYIKKREARSAILKELCTRIEGLLSAESSLLSGLIAMKLMIQIDQVIAKIKDLFPQGGQAGSRFLSVSGLENLRPLALGFSEATDALLFNRAGHTTQKPKARQPEKRFSATEQAVNDAFEELDKVLEAEAGASAANA